MMKTAVFCERGEPEKIQIAEVPRPQVGPGQALVRVKACGLNHFDLLVLREANSVNEFMNKEKVQ